MKKVFAALLAVAVTMGTLTGCGGNSEALKSAKAEEENSASEICEVSANSNIVVLDYAETTDLFPANMGAVVNYSVADLVYESLVDFDKNGDLEWVLATGCDISEDSLSYTFYLRKGVTFSDGEAWNAEACKVNFDTLMNDDYGFKDADFAKQIASVETVDEYTIKLTLNEVYAPFMNELVKFNGFVSPSQIEAGPDKWSSMAIGTGQYTLEANQSGEYMEFRLNRNYWGYNASICGGEARLTSNVGFNSITIKPISEEATRVSMLLAGQADAIDSVNSTNISTVQSVGDNYMDVPGIMISYLNFNCAKSSLSDSRVRKAIAMAINVEELNDVVYGGLCEPADSVAAPAVSYYEPQERYKYDVDAAKALLAEAGYANGMELVCYEGNDTSDIQRGEFISQQLSEIGIKLTCYPKESGVLGSEVHGYKGDPSQAGWDIYIRGYSAATLDPDQALGRYRSSLMPPNGVSNVNFYSNARFDELCAAGAKTTNTVERAAIYQEAQKILWEDMPVLPMLVNANTGAYGKHIQNLSFKPSGAFDWSDAVWVD